MYLEFLDVLSGVHIIFFFIIGLIIFAYTKKMVVGFAIGMIVAVTWEFIEVFILYGYFEIYLFQECAINIFADVFIFDVIGLFLAYIYSRKIVKRKG